MTVLAVSRDVCREVEPNRGPGGGGRIMAFAHAGIECRKQPECSRNVAGQMMPLWKDSGKGRKR